MNYDDMLLRHEPGCRIPLLDNLRARENWAKTWPLGCRACEGWGLQDGSDPSVGLAGSDPCSKCIEQGKCPRCSGAINPDGNDPCAWCGWSYEAADGAMPPPYECSCGDIAFERPRDVSPVSGGAATCPKCRRENIPTVDGLFAAHEGGDGRPCPGAIEYHIYRGSISEMYVVRDSRRAGSDPLAASLARGTFTASSPLHAVALMLHEVKPDYPPLDILSVLRSVDQRDGEWVVDARLWMETLQVKYAEVADAERAAGDRKPFVEPTVTEVGPRRADVEGGGVIC